MVGRNKAIRLSEQKGIGMLNYGASIVKDIVSSISSKVKNILIGGDDFNINRNNGSMSGLKYAFDNTEFCELINSYHGVKNDPHNTVDNLRKAGSDMLYSFNFAKDMIKTETDPYIIQGIIDDFSNIENYTGRCINLDDDTKSIIRNNIDKHVDKLRLYVAKSRVIKTFIDTNKLRQRKTLIEKILERF